MHVTDVNLKNWKLIQSPAVPTLVWVKRKNSAFTTIEKIFPKATQVHSITNKSKTNSSPNFCIIFTRISTMKFLLENWNSGRNRKNHMPGLLSLLNVGYKTTAEALKPG